MLWRTGNYVHDLRSRALIMGILNVTPDSFSDGGDFLDVPRAVDHALAMLAEGATIIDIGGESTRPGAPSVSPADELGRVMPVVEGILAASPSAILSVDTSKAVVARTALAAGAAIVNDVTALRGDPGMAETIAQSTAGVILMHMQGDPRTMQKAPSYADVVAEVGTFLGERRQHAVACGIAPGRIALDPGIGFGKIVEHNLSLLRHLGHLTALGSPLVVGVSRKSFLRKFAATDAISERLWPTLASTALLRHKGARIFRVHDVRPNLAALRLAEAMLAEDSDLNARPQPGPA